MAGNNNRSRRFFVLLLILLFILQACATTASAADPEMLSILPREWILTDELQEAEGEPQEADLAFLTLEDDGTFPLPATVKTADMHTPARAPGHSSLWLMATIS